METKFLFLRTQFSLCSNVKNKPGKKRKNRVERTISNERKTKKHETY